MRQRISGLLKGHAGQINPGTAFKIGLLTAGLALAVGCGSTSTNGPTQTPGETVPNVVTSEPPENTVFPTFTNTPFTLPSSTPFPTPSRTPFPTLTPTMFVVPTPTPIATPTRFVVPTPFPTASPTPFRTPTPTAIATSTPIPSQAAPVMTVASIGSGQSQVHLDITVASGTSVSATLSGPGVVSAALQTGIAPSSGQVRLTWTVNASGSYVASGTAGSVSISGNASVQ